MEIHPIKGEKTGEFMRQKARNFPIFSNTPPFFAPIMNSATGSIYLLFNLLLFFEDWRIIRQTYYGLKVKTTLYNRVNIVERIIFFFANWIVRIGKLKIF